MSYILNTRRYIVEVDVADLTTAGVTQVLDLNTLLAFPANALIIGSTLELDEAFTGGGATTCVAKLGDVGDDDELFAGVDIFATLGLKQCIATAITFMGLQTAYVPLLTVTADVFVNALTTGELQVHIIYIPDALST